MKLTKEIIRDVWLPALRSGKYSRGRMMLRNSNDGFCAIGVLCNEIDPDGWIPEVKYPGWDLWRDIPVGSIAAVVDYFSEKGSYLGYNELVTIISLNDNDEEQNSRYDKVINYLEKRLNDRKSR